MQELRVAVLDIVHVDHHVVAHLQREIQLVDLCTRAGIGRILGIQCRHLMAERRTVDLHENQTHAVGQIFHEGGLAVTGRRDQQQQPHEICPLGIARRSDLLGKVVTHDRQVNSIHQLVANEGRQHTRFKLMQAQHFFFALDQISLELLVLLKTWHFLTGETTQLLLENQVIKGVLTFLHGIVCALHALDHLLGGRFHHRLLVVMPAENQRGDFLKIFVLPIASKQKAAHPIAHELVETEWIILQRLLRLGKIGLAAFLHKMPFKFRQQLVRFLADSPVLAVCNFVK